MFSGSSNQKVEPADSTLLSAPTLPPCCSAKIFEYESPMPDPGRLFSPW